MMNEVNEKRSDSVSLKAVVGASFATLVVGITGAIYMNRTPKDDKAETTKPVVAVAPAPAPAVAPVVKEVAAACNDRAMSSGEARAVKEFYKLGADTRIQHCEDAAQKPKNTEGINYLRIDGAKDAPKDYTAGGMRLRYAAEFLKAAATDHVLKKAGVLPCADETSLYNITGKRTLNAKKDALCARHQIEALTNCTEDFYSAGRRTVTDPRYTARTKDTRGEEAKALDGICKDELGLAALREATKTRKVKPIGPAVSGK